jgi:FtsZ-binding cell division protein ZapB
MIPSLSVQPIKETIKGMIAAQDNKINELKEKKNEIKRNIQNLQVGVKTDKETLRNLKKKRKDNHTTNTKKKQSSE